MLQSSSSLTSIRPRKSKLVAQPGSEASQESESALDDRLGNWPRRLYHVESGTSYEWTPGNKYGEHIEPLYNALSYTWGRFALNDSQEPTVEALKVGGVQWDIPRINPVHFTLAQFEAAITEATMISPQAWKDHGVHTEPDPHYPEAVSFLWLDVACIDQRRNIDSMKEIGRQAKIFTGALCVYVWLNSHTYNELENMLITMDEVSHYAFAGLPVIWEGAEDFPQAVVTDDNPWKDYMDGDEAVWLEKALTCLETFLGDGVFTSLWCLQEAFLCPYAIFLSSDSGVVLLDQWNDGSHEFAGLKFLLHACDVLKRFCESERVADVVSTSSCIDFRKRLLGLISTRGLIALHETNPMALYASAHHRTASEELDYIYGIMQVFGLRLGNANPELNEPITFSLSDLEDQLGKALMEISPIWSQSHVHTEASRVDGKGWRLSRSSTTPGTRYECAVPWQLYSGEHLKNACEMTTKLVQGTRWGWFAGKACSFHTLQKVWADMYDARSRVEGLYGVISWKESDSQTQIVLDFAPDIFTHMQTLDNYRIEDAEGQHKLATWMADKFQPGQLQILHMASFDGSATYPRHSGLILLRRSRDNIDHWQRLGICTWDVEPDILRRLRLIEEGLLTRADGRVYDVETSPGILGSNEDELARPRAETVMTLACEGSEWKALEGLFN